MSSEQKECTMLICEFPDMDYAWECSNCQAMKKDTTRFMKSTHCPDCDAFITLWDDEGVYDAEDDVITAELPF